MHWIRIFRFIYNDDFLPNVNDIFYKTSENLLVIINIESNIQKISSELSSFKCIINNYNDNFLDEKKRKIIFAKRICIIDNCQTNEFYKYEYNNFCYNNCPSGTHSLNNNSFLCEENKVECKEDFPFLYLSDKSCVNNCFAEEFFDKKCSLNNDNNKAKKILIDNIRNEIEDGSLNKLLVKVINKENDLIIKEKI